VSADATREIAARLRGARDRAGLTLADVAAALRISQPAVSAIEAGGRPVRVDELVAIARLVSIDPSELLKDLGESNEPIGVTLRAEAAALPFAELRRAVTGFVDDLQSQQFPAPQAVVRSNHPEQAAKDARAQTGHTELPVDVRAIAIDLGVAVGTRPFPDALSALIVRHGQNAAIGVNATQAPVRQRFSIAHELGHFVLHHTDQHFIEYGAAPSVEGESPGYSWQAEQQANQFAAELLMPADSVRADAPQLSLTRLVRRYDVSEAAMGFRLANLGLLQHPRG
jgi:transcriptional regulator with XRE-family HTH domain